MKGDLEIRRRQREVLVFRLFEGREGIGAQFSRRFGNLFLCFLLLEESESKGIKGERRGERYDITLKTPLTMFVAYSVMFVFLVREEREY